MGHVWTIRASGRSGSHRGQRGDLWHVTSPAKHLEDLAMGLGWKELLIVLGIVLLIFGSKRIKTIGSDLGGAIRGFKNAMGTDQEKKDESHADS